MRRFGLALALAACLYAIGLSDGNRVEAQPYAPYTIVAVEINFVERYCYFVDIYGVPRTFPLRSLPRAGSVEIADRVLLGGCSIPDGHYYVLEYQWCRVVRDDGVFDTEYYTSKRPIWPFNNTLIGCFDRH